LSGSPVDNFLWWGEEMKHFWDGFEKRAGIGNFFKNVEEAAENINKFTSGAKHTEEYIRK